MSLPDSDSTGGVPASPRPSAPGTRKEEGFLLFDPAPEETSALSPESAASLRSLAASFVEEKNPAPSAPVEEGFSLTEVADRLKISLLAVSSGAGETEALDLLAGDPPEKAKTPPDQEAGKRPEAPAAKPEAPPAPAAVVAPVFPPPEAKPEPPSPTPAIPEPEPVEPQSAETALVLAGALLIFTGLASACAFAAGWLIDYHTPYDEQVAWRAAVLWRAFGAAGAVAGLTLGWGCLLRRRWAPPLLSATARSVLTAAVAALAGMALQTALVSFFPPMPGDDSTASTGLILPATGALAVWIVSALALAFGESAGVENVCRAADLRPRWTDRASPGALPLFTASLLLPAFYFAAMGFEASRPPGEQSAAACVPFLAALCVLLKSPRAAWWLLLIFTVVVTAWNVPRLPVPSSPSFAEAVSLTVALFLFPAATLFLSRGVLSRRR